MGRTEHHTTVSELGFSVSNEDLAIVNEYPGRWGITGSAPLPDNYWVVTMDGEGHPVTGHRSPQQILDWAERERGWQCAYVAPYGRFVQGEDDGIELHDWLKEGRHKQKAKQAEHHIN